MNEECALAESGTGDDTNVSNLKSSIIAFRLRIVETIASFLSSIYMVSKLYQF